MSDAGDLRANRQVQLISDIVCDTGSHARRSTDARALRTLTDVRKKVVLARLSLSSDLAYRRLGLSAQSEPELDISALPRYPAHLKNRNREKTTISLPTVRSSQSQLHCERCSSADWSLLITRLAVFEPKLSVRQALRRNLPVSRLVPRRSCATRPTRADDQTMT
jgi:hypothetical protein